jgi:ribokinase
VKAVDTTAAGDAFNGALASALDEGQTIQAALQRAMAAGALSTTRPGAQPSMAGREEVLQMVERK